MKEFNYQDYLKYQELKNREAKKIEILCEPEEKYHVHQPHDNCIYIRGKAKSRR